MKERELCILLKKEIYYDNKAMDLCFYWDKVKDFKKGDYSVDIYIDNYLLGSSTLIWNNCFLNIFVILYC